MDKKLNMSDRILIILYTLPALILLIVECSCNTPSAVIYQQGTCIGNNKVKVEEVLHLNKVISIHDCKCDSGKKIITKITLN